MVPKKNLAINQTDFLISYSLGVWLASKKKVMDFDSDSEEPELSDDEVLGSGKKLEKMAPFQRNLSIYLN